MRQDSYGHRFGDGSYTPEIVVDGMVGLVGSHRDEVNAERQRALPGSALTGRSRRPESLLHIGADPCDGLAMFGQMPTSCSGSASNTP
jgi:hypothetical protein